MKRQILNIIAVVILFSAVFTSCKKEKDEEEVKMMTLTTSAPGEVYISLAGTEMAAIDWGDGSEKETKTLTPSEPPIGIGSNNIIFRHDYYGTGICTIRIYGNNITGLYCSSNQISSLEVNNNTALKYLSCWGNQLTNLDVSNNVALSELECSYNQLTNLEVGNNIALKYLGCDGNQLMSLDVSNNSALIILRCKGIQLTSLDVGNNTALKFLYCQDNQLKSLDVSNNTVLWRFNCSNNLFDTAALNVLFSTLHGNTIDWATVYIGDNPGTDDCNLSIATEKGWMISLFE